MTLGKKLKEARKQAGLSQEQLSEKLGVSRSAVAKWETDNGIPDVDNLKILSKLLNISIDYLLDNGEAIDELVMREPYNLSEYGKGGKGKRKDRAVLDKFPNAEIHTLIGEQKLTKGEKVIDNVLGIFTDAPFGIPGLINSVKNTDKQFYLVEKDGKQFFVTVTDEFIETRQLAKRMNSKKIEIGNWRFTKCEEVYCEMIHRDIMSPQKTILVLFLVVLVGVFFVLDILPKGIAQGFACVGIKLDSSDLGTKYGMGITVRLLGLALLLPILSQLSDMRIFTYRIDKTCFALSWLFFVYIAANLEIGSVAHATPRLLLLMVLECIAIGFYEEILFRGVLLRQYIELFGNSHRRIIWAVFASSLMFSLTHMMNFRTGVSTVAVLSQVGYTFIMGVAFSALLIRTNWNLLWCGILHSIYDMVGGFGDFYVRQATTEAIASNNTPSAGAYLMNLCLFIPLLLYAVFLLRKDVSH